MWDIEIFARTVDPLREEIMHKRCISLSFSVKISQLLGHVEKIK